MFIVLGIKDKLMSIIYFSWIYFHISIFTNMLWFCNSNNIHRQQLWSQKSLNLTARMKGMHSFSWRFKYVLIDLFLLWSLLINSLRQKLYESQTSLMQQLEEYEVRYSVDDGQPFVHVQSGTHLKPMIFI